jgi:hypothetical protein
MASVLGIVTHAAHNMMQLLVIDIVTFFLRMSG